MKFEEICPHTWDCGSKGVNVEINKRSILTAIIRAAKAPYGSPYTRVVLYVVMYTYVKNTHTHVGTATRKSIDWRLDTGNKEERILNLRMFGECLVVCCDVTLAAAVYFTLLWYEYLEYLVQYIDAII